MNDAELDSADLLDRERQLAELFVGAQEALEHLLQRVLGDDDGLDEEVGDARDIVERDDVVRVEDADREPVAARSIGISWNLRHRLPGTSATTFGSSGRFAQIDIAMPGVQRDRLGDLRLGHHASS